MIYLRSALCLLEGPRMLVGLWLDPACNGWAGGAVGKGLTRHVPPVDWSRMTGRWEVNAERKIRVNIFGVRAQRTHCTCNCVTWISRVLGIHRKLTVIDSFFINSEAMSPNPAPCSQSRTRSKFVRIWTALDHEKSPSNGREEIEKRCYKKRRLFCLRIVTFKDHLTFERGNNTSPFYK